MRRHATTMDPKRDAGSPAMPGIASWLRRFDPAPGDSKQIGWRPALDRGRGSGARIALLDSGLDWGLRVFRGAAVRARDFTGSRELYDPTGHGTADASLLVGQAAGGFEGLMPVAELLFGRVLRPGAGDPARAVADGLRWAAGHGVDVIVLPFGTTRGSTAIAAAIRTAVRAGCTIVAATGNRGSEQVCFPAWLDEVVAVTGVDTAGRPVPGCCSVERADLAAPGSGVPAMGAHGPASLSGSSPAAVIAGGILALRRAAERNLGPSDSRG